MSIEALNAVLAWQVPEISKKRASRPAVKAVALVLANYADAEGGSIFPSVATIAARSGCSERAVQYVLAWLRAEGILEGDTRGGRGATTRYRMRLEHLSETVQPLRPSAPETPQALHPLTAERVQGAHEKGARLAPDPSVEPSGVKEEPSLRSGSRQGDLVPLPVFDLASTAPAEQAIARRVADAVRVGHSWDLPVIAADAWTEVVRPGDVQAGGRFLAAVWLAICGDDEGFDWRRASKLARLYGRFALYGLTEALSRDLDEPWNYATTVAKHASQEARQA